MAVKQRRYSGRLRLLDLSMQLSAMIVMSTYNCDAHRADKSAASTSDPVSALGLVTLIEITTNFVVHISAHVIGQALVCSLW